jgi:SAM-dependent methyltransferase
VNSLRTRVRATYDRVAREPEGEFHFHRGPAYARELLGCHPLELAQVPSQATARFAGVGNPFHAGPIHPGERVLDHACGAGTDLLLAALRVGRRGQAIGVDMTPGMRAAATLAARQARLSEVVEIREGFMESLPVADASVDVVISNGVVNLSPDKPAVFREIQRVLRPGGRLYLADVVVASELTLDARENPELWAACVAGALVEDELPAVANAAGLTDCRLVACYDCFRGTSAEVKVARHLEIHAVTLYARKREEA